MSVFFRRRNMPPLHISVTITTEGGHEDSSRGYAVINGVTYYRASEGVEVNAGDTITFGVYGRSTEDYGEVRIDGTQVLKVVNQSVRTYAWTVPTGIRTILINIAYGEGYSGAFWRTTVTTS